MISKKIMHVNCAIMGYRSETASGRTGGTPQEPATFLLLIRSKSGLGALLGAILFTE